MCKLWINQSFTVNHQEMCLFAKEKININLHNKTFTTKKILNKSIMVYNILKEKKIKPHLEINELIRLVLDVIKVFVYNIIYFNK